jgi:hypothetical protein
MVSACEVSGPSVRQRETLFILIVAIVVSLVVARICAYLLPFRERPMFSPDIGYAAPAFTRSIRHTIIHLVFGF